LCANEFTARAKERGGVIWQKPNVRKLISHKR
jgi:hypothetical protein